MQETNAKEYMKNRKENKRRKRAQLTNTDISSKIDWSKNKWNKES
jgi:hypothetical protein